MSGINGKLQVQGISWILNRNVFCEMPENTGSNNFMDEKLFINFMDRKFTEAVKFVTKIFGIINMDIQSIHIRHYYTIFTKFLSRKYKKLLISEVDH